ARLRRSPRCSLALGACRLAHPSAARYSALASSSRDPSMSFTAPVSDQRLTLDAVVRIGELPGGPDSDMVDAVLEGAAALAEGEFAPLARSGDMIGARWDNGAVTMPPGYKAAWQAFVEGGWMTLAAPEQHGGQGLPYVLSAALMDNL